MFLEAKELLDEQKLELRKIRENLAVKPGLALVWVGDDPQTGAFVRAKQRYAQELDCQFFLHKFDHLGERQLGALIESLNQNKFVHGIVLQLPLPQEINIDRMIALINPDKDVDGLGRNSKFEPPTPSGIIALLIKNKIDPGKLKTVILGAGRLVGAPLAKVFNARNWNYSQIDHSAETKIDEIKSADLLIACTGVDGLITPEMVRKEMVLIDGSGVDVDVDRLEPLVAAITPKKGAIGPLTVANLFKNLLQAVSS